MTARTRMIAAAALALLPFMLAVPAGAQFTGPGRETVTTVAEAHNARDDAPFDLTGNITERLRDEYFTFQDETGSIVAEIERVRFRGREVTPETTVRITGEVDRNLRGRELEVRRLEIVE